MNCHVYVDFDGTIASQDTTDRVLERFADPTWEVIEDDWRAGRIGSRECLVRQIDLIRATPEALDSFVAEIPIDPGFAKFVSECTTRGFPVTVVSDGLDRNIRTLLGKAGLNLAFYANHLSWMGDDRWRITFPHARQDCSTLSGNCKCGLVSQADQAFTVLIGDGRSDFCAAEHADLVLSKNALTEYCITNGIRHLPFKDFEEARHLLASWLSAQTPNEPASVGVQGEK